VVNDYRSICRREDNTCSGFLSDNKDVLRNKNGEILVLENIRFTGRKKKYPAFAKQLASLADVYVNDAFAVCHARRSVVGVPKLLPSYGGILLKKRLK